VATAVALSRSMKLYLPSFVRSEREPGAEAMHSRYRKGGTVGS